MLQQFDGLELADGKTRGTAYFRASLYTPIKLWSFRALAGPFAVEERMTATMLLLYDAKNGSICMNFSSCAAPADVRPAYKDEDWYPG